MTRRIVIHNHLPPKRKTFDAGYDMYTVREETDAKLRSRLNEIKSRTSAEAKEEAALIQKELASRRSKAP